MARKFTGALDEAARAVLDAQAHYVFRLGVYQQATEEANALWSVVPDDADDETFDAAFARIESLAPTTGAYDALRVQEDILINACRRFCALDPRTARKFAASAGMLDKLFNGYRRYPSIAEKLIAACAKIDPYK